jgi:hypothetical protein
MRKSTYWILSLFCICVIGMMIYFANHLPFNDGSGVRNAEYFSWYGVFISGVVGTLFAIGSFVVLFITYREQAFQFRKSFAAQREAGDKAIFEKRFYEMVQIHRDNVRDLELTQFTGKNHIQPSETKIISTGRKVFKLIVDELIDLERETRHLFGHHAFQQIYLSDYLARVQQNEVYQQRQISLELMAKYDILYLIVFFGLGKSGKAIAVDYLSSRYYPAFYESVIDLAAMKPKMNSKHWPSWEKFNGQPDYVRMHWLYQFRLRREPNDLIEPYPRYSRHANTDDQVMNSIYYNNDYEKYYGGHQFRLGHYFRHLFQAVKFVNESVLDPRNVTKNAKEQYDYVKFLRAQLSTYEQILLALNSLSIIGRAWEMERYGGVAPAPAERLISKYNLIRNIPGLRLTDDIDLVKLYPVVDYEVKNNPDIAVIRAAEGYAN